MRWRVRIVKAAIPLMMCGDLQAQGRPDFSGTWVATSADATTSTAKPSPPIFGTQFTISQMGQTLTLTRTMSGTPSTVAYTLDGSETTSRMPGRLCEADSGAIWRATQDDARVTLTMIGAVAPNGKRTATDVTTTLEMESSDMLRVETATRTPGQNVRKTIATSYKRSGPAPQSPAAPAKTQATIGQVAWISGVWIGTSGQMTFDERWTPSAGGSMMAISRAIRDGVMSGFEYLCIVERDGGLVYVAMPNGRMPPTDFTLTKIDADNAIFENPAHDYPQVIRYTKRADGSLEAVTSLQGGQKPQTFVFKRQD